MPTKFHFNVELNLISIPNSDQINFRKTLNDLPYLVYEVENLRDGNKIVINKPGGKRNFGKLSKNDFMVFVFNPLNKELWLISHKEIFEDIKNKILTNRTNAEELLDALQKVCNGKEPDDVLKEIKIEIIEGMSFELILKLYKWIWGQEDVNYPKGKGRWLSMEGISKLFKT